MRNMDRLDFVKENNMTEEQLKKNNNILKMTPYQ